MKTLIYLKGGAVIDVELEKFTTTGNGDGLSRFKWTSAEGAMRKLHTINLNEIAAVVIDDGDDE